MPGDAILIVCVMELITLQITFFKCKIKLKSQNIIITGLDYEVKIV